MGEIEREREHTYLEERKENPLQENSGDQSGEKGLQVRGEGLGEKKEEAVGRHVKLYTPQQNTSWFASIYKPGIGQWVHSPQLYTTLLHPNITYQVTCIMKSKVGFG